MSLSGVRDRGKEGKRQSAKGKSGEEEYAYVRLFRVAPLADNDCHIDIAPHIPRHNRLPIRRHRHRSQALTTLGIGDRGWSISLFSAEGVPPDAGQREKRCSPVYCQVRKEPALV
ncbi:MAG: hypothetical protein KF893_27180 [Caldilineaceae bacterium]|nr:hypothetical protein [Caldilineaceae bacterium]